MATMDVFNSNAFSLTALSSAVDKMDYKPGLLGELGIFEKMPVRTRNIFVDQRDGALNVIQTSSTGAPPEELKRDDRKAIPLKAVRLAKGATIYASEIASWRAFGTESEQTVVMGEYARRMERVRQDMELTHEKHRLGALTGTLLDADGATIYDYFTQFGVAVPPSISFELDVPATEVRTICHQITRGMAKRAKGAFTSSTKVHALVGDDFYDALIAHPNVKNTYLNWSAAADLRQNTAYGAFEFGGITFHNYRGTDDGTTVAVAANQCKLFPVGADGVFVQAMAPADEFIPYVGAPGQNVYSMNITDRDRGAFVRNEQYSYPLYLCQQPACLQAATLT